MSVRAPPGPRREGSFVLRQSTVFASVGTATRAAKLWAAALVLAALLAVVMADEADASYYGGWADSDGYVPVYSSCWAGYEIGSPTPGTTTATPSTAPSTSTTAPWRTLGRAPPTASGS